MSAEVASSSTREKAWETVVEQFNIVSRLNDAEFVDIQASELKRYFEPRLLAKIDHEKQLPPVFRENGIRILPLSISTYRLGRFEIFHSISESQDSTKVTAPKRIPAFVKTLNAELITSEQAAIYAASMSGVLEDFTGEESVLVNSGRMRTGEFEFAIEQTAGGNLTIPVKNAQIEIDAGFEAEHSLILIEAKNHSAVDFNVRQLYYPFRSWLKRIDKPVRSVFMTYVNREMRVNEYEFIDPLNFSSIRPVRSGVYTFSDAGIPRDKLFNLARSLEKVGRYDIPFPQADSFQRVLDLIEILIDKPRELADLTGIFGFVGRQANYYSDAGRYLGLIEKRTGPDGHKYLYASPEAVRIAKLEYRDRQVEYSKILLTIDSVAKVFSEMASSGRPVSLARVREIFNASPDSQFLSGSTIERRALTVKAWCQWLWEISE